MIRVIRQARSASSCSGNPTVAGSSWKRVKPSKVAKRRGGSDELRSEYDFSRARPNKYAARYVKGSIVVTLDPDVAAVFPGAREVNDALRVLAGAIRRARRSARRSA